MRRGRSSKDILQALGEFINQLADVILSEDKVRVILPEGDGAARASALGLLMMERDGLLVLDEPMFGTSISQALSSFDFYADEPVQLASIQVPNDQAPKELIFIPALLFLALIAWLQTGRAAATLPREGERT